MHEDEIAPSEPKPFSAWKWLGGGSDDNGDVTLPAQSCRQEQDALYALGVAGLASKKLLQRHRVSSDALRNEAAEAEAEESSSAATTTVDAVVVSEQEERRPRSLALLGATALLLERAGTVRRSLHEYQGAKLRAAASLLSPARLLRRIFALGGGRPAVAATAAIAAALVLALARPVAHFVASESLNVTRGA